VGTQFNVNRQSDLHTNVAVLEGVVQITPSKGQSGFRVVAGDEVDIEHGSVIKKLAPNVQRAVAWRARKLVFEGDSLDAVAREFNRYNVVPIRIEGTALAGRKMTGVFDADDPALLLQFLERDPQLIVLRSEHGIVIRERASLGTEN